MKRVEEGRRDEIKRELSTDREGNYSCLEGEKREGRDQRGRTKE